MCFKYNIKIHLCCRIFSRSTMLRMNSTPGSSVPYKSIKVGTRIMQSYHNLIRSSSRIWREFDPSSYSPIISIRHIGDSTQGSTRIGTISKVGCCCCRKSPHKHDISRGFFISDIDGFKSSTRSCRFPCRRRSHSIPSASCPSHAIRIRVGIKDYHSEIICSRL